MLSGALSTTSSTHCPLMWGVRGALRLILHFAAPFHAQLRQPPLVFPICAAGSSQKLGEKEKEINVPISGDGAGDRCCSLLSFRGFFPGAPVPFLKEPSLGQQHPRWLYRWDWWHACLHTDFPFPCFPLSLPNSHLVESPSLSFGRGGDSH